MSIETNGIWTDISFREEAVMTVGLILCSTFARQNSTTECQYKFHEYECLRLLHILCHAVFEMKKRNKRFYKGTIHLKHETLSFEIRYTTSHGSFQGMVLPIHGIGTYFCAGTCSKFCTLGPLGHLSPSTCNGSH